MQKATPEFEQRLREAFDEMHVGQTFTFQRTFTGGDVALFCGVTGDYNPYNQDESFAEESPYGRLTIPGLLTGNMLTHIGGLLGFLATGMTYPVPRAGLRRGHHHLRRNRCAEGRGEAPHRGERRVREPGRYGGTMGLLRRLPRAGAPCALRTSGGKGRSRV